MLSKETCVKIWNCHNEIEKAHKLIKDMAEQIVKLTATKSQIVFVPQRAFNTQTEAPDTSKAKRLLKWEAKTTFAEGLKKTYEWMRAKK